MSLLNVLSTPFPHFPITHWLTDATDWNQIKPCATPLWGGPSGHLADPTRNTGYEPKFCIDVSSEHTPINLPTRNMSFKQEFDAAINSRASSSSQHTAASTVSTFQNLVHGLSLAKLASRRLVRTWIEGKRKSRPKRCANVGRQAESPKNPCERNAEMAVRGESHLSKGYTKLRPGLL